MDCTTHGILQARILEWVAFPFSKGSSQPGDQTRVSHIAGRFFTSCATREANKVGGCCQKVAKFILGTIERDVNWTLVLPRSPEHPIRRAPPCGGCGQPGNKVEPEGVAKEAEQGTLRGPWRNRHGSAIFLAQRASKKAFSCPNVSWPPLFDLRELQNTAVDLRKRWKSRTEKERSPSTIPLPWRQAG